MSTPPSAVRPASAADLAPLGTVLARAFRDDPIHRWILPREIDWSLFSEGFFRMVVRDALRDGGAWTTEAHDGAALWFPPYRTKAPLPQKVAMGLRWAFSLGRRAGPVAREFLRLERAHPLEPHWYLAVLGTDPRHQRRGVGAALLAPVLERCDADRIPAYLESSKRSNVPFYERHGFRLQDEFQLAGGPPVWRMLREARR